MASPANQVGRHREIDKGDLLWHLVFMTFLLDLISRENHVDRGSRSPKSILEFWIDTISNNLE